MKRILLWLLASVCLLNFAAALKISEVIWTTDVECSISQCRMTDSASKKVLTTSCERELCSKHELVLSSEESLRSRPLAFVLLQYESSTISEISRYLQGVVDVFIQNQDDTQIEHGLAHILEYGQNKFGAEPFNIVQALHRGTLGGLRNILVGPVQPKPHLPSKASALACIRELRRQSPALDETDTDKFVRMMKTCSGMDLPQDNEDFEHNRAELWVKALKLNLLDASIKNTKSHGEYAAEIWRDVVESRSAKDDKIWLSVSWVPVFDYYHQGLGHGDRYEALLLELVQIEPFNPNVPTASAILSTKGGRIGRVKSRHLFALLACEDDDLESVVRCLKRATPNIFMLDQIVWGMGFVGDYSHYHELEDDWNADPVYSSHGQFPPKYEDIAHRQELDNSSLVEEKDGSEVKLAEQPIESGHETKSEVM